MLHIIYFDYTIPYSTPVLFHSYKEWWVGVIRLITQEYTGPMYIVLILT